VLWTQPEPAVEQSESFYPKRYVAASFGITLQGNIRPGDYTNCGRGQRRHRQPGRRDQTDIHRFSVTRAQKTVFSKAVGQTIGLGGLFRLSRKHRRLADDKKRSSAPPPEPATLVN